MRVKVVEHHKNFAASCGDISDRNQFDLRTSCPRRDSSLSNVQGTQSLILGLHVLKREGGGRVQFWKLQGFARHWHKFSFTIKAY